MADTVWGFHQSSNDGGRLIDLYATRDDAMRALVQKHRECMRDAAVIDAFWRKEYTERASQETDPRMRAYYEEKASNPDQGALSEIDERGYRTAKFTHEPDVYYITEHTIKTYRPTPTPEAARAE